MNSRFVGLNEPVQRQSVVDTVLDRIKYSIITGDLKPGDKLPTEIELSQSLGVGRTSVREAIKKLDALGLIEVRRGDGTYIVDKLNANSMNPLILSIALRAGTNMDLVGLRYMVEVGYTQLAIDRMDENDIVRVKEVLDRHEAAVSAEQYEQLGQIEYDFHFAIIEATKNPLVIELSKAVMDIFVASISHTTKIVPERALEDHRRIYDALVKRDKAAAEDAIHRSFEVWRHYVTYEKKD